MKGNELSVIFSLPRETLTKLIEIYYVAKSNNFKKKRKRSEDLVGKTSYTAVLQTNIKNMKNITNMKKNCCHKGRAE